MANNPIFAILWIALLYFITWPVALLCSGFWLLIQVWKDVKISSALVSLAKNISLSSHRRARSFLSSPHSPLKLASLCWEKSLPFSKGLWHGPEPMVKPSAIAARPFLLLRSELICLAPKRILIPLFVTWWEKCLEKLSCSRLRFLLIWTRVQHPAVPSRCHWVLSSVCKPPASNCCHWEKHWQKNQCTAHTSSNEDCSGGFVAMPTNVHIDPRRGLVYRCTFRHTHKTKMRAQLIACLLPCSMSLTIVSAVVYIPVSIARQCLGQSFS